MLSFPNIFLVSLLFYSKLRKVNLKRCFHQTDSKLSSFQRQLNLYGFKKVFRGEDKDCYFHLLFQKGRDDLLPSLKRPPSRKRKKLQSRSEDEEENWNEDDVIDSQNQNLLKKSSKPLPLQDQEYNTPFSFNTPFAGECNTVPETYLQPLFSRRSADQQEPIHPFPIHLPYVPFPAAAIPGQLNGFLPVLSSSSSVPPPASLGISSLPFHPFLPPYSPWGYYPLQQLEDNNSHSDQHSSAIIFSPQQQSTSVGNSSSPTLPNQAFHENEPSAPKGNNAHQRDEEDI
jgi:hypothetical protein